MLPQSPHRSGLADIFNLQLSLLSLPAPYSHTLSLRYPCLSYQVIFPNPLFFPWVVYQSEGQWVLVSGQKRNRDLTWVSGSEDRWTWSSLPDESTLHKGKEVWQTPCGWSCDESWCCYVKKNPCGWLCCSLIRGAEGACLGLRVKLSIHSPWREKGMREWLSHSCFNII